MELVACWALAALFALCAPGTSSAAVFPGCPEKYVTYTGRGKTPCCSRCRPGTSMQDECTETSKSVCTPCTNGSYSDIWNNMFTCIRCAECIDEGMKYKRKCTSISNAVCECSVGYACEDQDCKSCVVTDSQQGGDRSTESPKHSSRPDGIPIDHSPGSDIHVQSIPCPTGTYSDTETKTCQLWTNCTALGHIEITPANQTSDAICTPTPSSRPESHNEVRVATITVAFICFFLLCLSVGLHIVSWRRNRRKEFKLLPGEICPRLLNERLEDTCSTHFPQQECGGISHQEKKSTEQAYVAVHCSC
uniref:tumor necrosis factor receptor superfamily member 9-like n=1 Tax=Pristiophorus japonicus TaxID=55135 RepID=UPI00398E649D